MIDHVTFRMKDIDKTKQFYTKILTPLGYELAVDEVYDGIHFLGFKKDGKTDLWFSSQKQTSGQFHIAWKARTRTAVDEFYAIAIKAGAKDNGAPGLRPHYGENYYAAFVIDPDGNNIEAVCYDPQ